MPDSAPLLHAVDSLADRFRAMPQSGLLASAGTGTEAGTGTSAETSADRLTRAAEGLALARRLAEAAQRLEAPGLPPRLLPGAGAFAVGDQIAVAGHDLAAALAGRSAADPDPEAAKVLEDALRDVAVTAELI